MEKLFVEAMSNISKGESSPSEAVEWICRSRYIMRISPSLYFARYYDIMANIWETRQVAIAIVPLAFSIIKHPFRPKIPV